MNQIGENLRELYDNYYGSEGLAEWRRLGAVDKATNIRDLCADQAVRSVVDIGCGDGAIIARLAELSFAQEYRGVDISKSAIAAARAKNVQGASFDTFSGEALDFRDGKFDLAVLSHVVEHLEHPRVLLKEAKRVARRVLVEVPCEHTVRLAHDYREDGVGHINFYTPTTLRRLVQTCGLVVDKQITRGCSLEVMRFKRPWAGLLQHVVREATLRLVPKAAPAVFVYHTAVLCH